MRSSSETKRAILRPSGTRRDVLGALLLVLVGTTSAPPRPATAADHVDAPLTADIHAADLADLYAWHTERGTIVMVLTFGSLLVPGDAPVYDSDTVYVIHIDNTADPLEKADFTDNDNDNLADVRIHVRFGQNDHGDWGVQWNGVPGADDETFDGPVQTPLANGTATVIAGHFDDPFFFDFEGFVTTRDNLLDDADPFDFAFASIVAGAPVDFFAGTNAMAIVLEVDAGTTMADNPDGFLQIWATSGTL
jgi:hypothetical protein